MRRSNISSGIDAHSPENEPIIASTLLERIGLALLTSAVGTMGVMALLGKGF